SAVRGSLGRERAARLAAHTDHAHVACTGGAVAGGALLAAQPLGVRLDAVPLGVARKNDVAVQKISLPSNLKKGQTFDAKIFATSDTEQKAIVRLYRNEQLLGEQPVELAAGKNLFTFPQTLDDPGFYSYNVQIEAPGDMLPQNNKAVSFTSVRGDPRVLILSSDPQQDAQLAAVLRDSKLEVKLIDAKFFPDTLAEIQSYDAIFLSNVAAGDLGDDRMKMLESAVRDFGIGLVCIGGDQAFAAGGYRGTALERTLPLDMELSSKKVLPSGAVALVMHGMEFMNGNEIARQCALGVLEALGPQDELGIVLWDGKDRWLFPMTKAGNKKDLAKQISGMNQGDLPSFQNVMSMAHEGLKKSTGNLKHMIVFSDGDPGAPSIDLMKAIVGDRITVSTVLIAGHAGPETMIWIAENGRGRFYDVRSPEQLPQIFIKEAAVILKSAIVEEPFKPQLAAGSEILRGIGANEYPRLLGYVSTTAKPRAEIPLLSEKGDPLLAHWNYGLGRAVAFTSDAKSRWATDWIGWAKYKQFWSQAAQWSLRKIENADFVTEVSVDGGVGHIAVEAVDEQGNYRNFLNLQTVVVSPKGERQTVRLEQTGPGHYEARFPTKEVGAYLLNLMDIQDGQLRGSQV
ncbi:MAG: glutamine amidotransferase, partial [Limisphaerales bacterium]